MTWFVVDYKLASLRPEDVRYTYSELVDREAFTNEVQDQLMKMRPNAA